MKERVVIFCRYPSPGEVKTRLISVLGAEGAARLQREMAEHLIGWMREASRQRGCGIEIRYTGGNEMLMREMFGDDLNYRDQGDGDLGARLGRIFEDAFQEGEERVLVVGADCPTVTADVIADAFDALDGCDVALGPATDGGYYLIGLKKAIRELFLEIPWGSSSVLGESIKRIAGAGASLHLLEKSSDVDVPADLAVWNAARMSPPPRPSSPPMVERSVEVYRNALSIQPPPTTRSPE